MPSSFVCKGATLVCIINTGSLTTKASRVFRLDWCKRIMPKRLPPLRVTGLKIEGKAGKPADFVRLNDVAWHAVTTFKNKNILEIPITYQRKSLWTFFLENREELLVKRVTCLNERGEQVTGDARLCHVNGGFEVCLQKATWYDIGRDLDLRDVQDLPEKARRIVRRIHLRYVRTKEETKRLRSDTTQEHSSSGTQAASTFDLNDEEEYDMFLAPLFTSEDPVFEEWFFSEEQKSEELRPLKRQKCDNLTTLFIKEQSEATVLKAACKNPISNDSVTSGAQVRQDYSPEEDKSVRNIDNDVNKRRFRLFMYRGKVVTTVMLLQNILGCYLLNDSSSLFRRHNRFPCGLITVLVLCVVIMLCIAEWASRTTNVNHARLIFGRLAVCNIVGGFTFIFLFLDLHKSPVIPAALVYRHALTIGILSFFLRVIGVHLVHRMAFCGAGLFGYLWILPVEMFSKESTKRNVSLCFALASVAGDVAGKILNFGGARGKKMETQAITTLNNIVRVQDKV